MSRVVIGPGPHAAPFPRPGQRLRKVLDDRLGERWLVDLQMLRGLESYADDAGFRDRWRAVKPANKARLADYVRAKTGIDLEPDRLFDIQVKRIHEYKRQDLNVLHIITLYHRLKQNPGLEIPPRAFILAAKPHPVIHGQADHQVDQLRR